MKGGRFFQKKRRQRAPFIEERSLFLVGVPTDRSRLQLLLGKRFGSGFVQELTVRREAR